MLRAEQTRNSWNLVTVACAILAGWAAASGHWLALAASVTSIGALAIGSLIQPQTATRLLAWIGVLLPMAITEPRTGTEVAEAAFTPITVLYAVVPVTCLIFAWLSRPCSLLPRNGCEKCLCAYLVTVVLSTAWSAFPLITFLAALQLVVGYLLLLLLTRNSPYPLRELAAVIFGLTVAVAINFVVFPEALAPGSEVDPVQRLQSIYPSVSTNMVGFVAAAAIIFVVGRVGPLWSTRGPVRICLGTIAVGELLLSRTRTYFVLAILGVLAMGFLLSYRRRLLIIAAPAVVAAAIVLFSFAQSQLDSYLRRGQTQASLETLTGRTKTWELAIEEWQRQPIQGLGYFAGHRFNDNLSSLGREVPNIDNTWLETLMDVGLLGLVCLGGFVFAGSRLWLKAPRDAVAIGLLTLCLGGSTVNPSLQQVGYPMLVLGCLLLTSKPDPYSLTRSSSRKTKRQHELDSGYGFRPRTAPAA